MITPLEAWDLVQLKTQEHFDGEGGSGIGVVMGELGISEEELLEALPRVFYAQTMVTMPVPSQLLGAFVAGALWRSRAEAEPGEIVITDAMIERAASAEFDDWPDLGEAEREECREASRRALEAALDPAAGPPTDDGVGGSS